MKITRTALTVLAAGLLALAPAAHATPVAPPGSGLPGPPDSGSPLPLPGPGLPTLPGPADIPAAVDAGLPDLTAIPGPAAIPEQLMPQVPGGGSGPAAVPPAAPGADGSSALRIPAPATGCSPQAKACVDLSDQTAWLQSGGVITRGPVPVSTGRPGYATPAGLTRVTRKVKDEWSGPYNGPMPYSVYFSAGAGYPNDRGIAFHEGDPGVLSHGCVHLNHDDAVAFFTTLSVGDYVDVVD